jgi:excisionase family DNA binding protein
MTTTQQPTSAEIGGYDLAETVTGIKRSSLYAMVHHRQIPHIRVGRRCVRFRRRDLEAWLDARFQAAVGDDQ